MEDIKAVCCSLLCGCCIKVLLEGVNAAEFAVVNFCEEHKSLDGKFCGLVIDTLEDADGIAHSHSL